MAGVGVKLNRIYRRKTLVSRLSGLVYSTALSVVPMFSVIGAILIAQLLLGFSGIDYMRRELFADTVLYTFIFSVLFTSPYNAFLSKYVSDVIFREKFEHILPCFYIGMGICMTVGAVAGVLFCVHEHFVGGVPLYYVFTGYCGFVALMLVFYTMLYLSIAKSYGKISLFFFIGMTCTVLLSLLFHKVFGMEATYALLLSLVIGYSVIAILEIGLVRSYFATNSGDYREVFGYLKAYKKMIPINFFYTLGLYIHNFVFWNSHLRNVLVRSFITAKPYDMATCLAMFTNISATVIFITNVELHFRDRYRRYFEAVIGGRGHDIDSAKRRMFRQLSAEIMTLVRVQFIISVVVFLICMLILPALGFAGLVMQIYPCLCVGFFILFVMYSEILFLYYYNDLNGALLTSVSFCLVTFIGSIFASRLQPIWYGLGLFAGSLTGFSCAYFRLRRIEQTLDERIFCRENGSVALIERGRGKRPESVAYRS